MHIELQILQSTFGVLLKKVKHSSPLKNNITSIFGPMDGEHYASFLNSCVWYHFFLVAIDERKCNQQ